MNKVWLVFVIVFMSISTHGQNLMNKDSLLRLLPNAKEDSLKVMLLLKIADNYEANNQDSAIYYLEKSKQLSDILKFAKGTYHYYEQSAIVSFTKGDYNLSLNQSNNAIKIARELKDPDLIINMLNNTGIVYQYLGEFDKQLEYTLQALEFAKKNNLNTKLPQIFHNLANAYYNIGQFKKSIDYCHLALTTFKKNKKENHYINRIYASLGQDYASLKLTDSALYYYKLAIKESIKSNDKYAEAAIYGYMTNTYADRNEFEQMEKVANKSLVLAKELQSNQLISSSFYNIAYANYFNGQNIEAKKNIVEALQIATKDSLLDELKNIYPIFSFIAARDGDFSSSFWAKKKGDSVQEKLLNIRVLNNISELEKKYESEKKNSQIKLQQLKLKQKSKVNYMLIGASIALLLFMLLLYRNNTHKQKMQELRINELEKEKQLTATEAVLKGEEQERIRLAKDLHDGLGGMLSGIKYSFQTMKQNLIMSPDNQQSFERSMDMLDSSIKEMRRVAHNMMPESLVKFGLDIAVKDFCNEINTSGVLNINYQSIGMNGVIIEQTTAITVYRVIQELTNNIIKHASAKSAIVQLTYTDGILAVTVEDDGKGFKIEKLGQAKGMGWVNIKNRIDFLGGMVNIDSELGKGTSVHIEINA